MIRAATPFAWTSLVAFSWLLVSCRPLSGEEDCYQGMALGQVVEVELIETHSRAGRYLYWDRGVAGIPCEGEDGLGPGSRLRFRLSDHGTQGGCWTYWGELLTPVTGVSLLTQSRSGAGAVVGSQNRFESPTCASTFWRFYALRHPSLDDTPLDEPADPGRFPPVVVLREINGCCVDQWSAAIRTVPSLDAGTDTQ